MAYLDEGSVSAEFRNTTTKMLEIVEASCSFELEPGAKLPDPIRPMAKIPPSNLKALQIPFRASLSFKPFTNSYSIVLRYRFDGESVDYSVGFPSKRYLVIVPVRETGKHFFISHKDPEQATLASRLDYNLSKIGFKGYVAEKQRRPGSGVWEEKLIPAITTSFGFIMLWTADANRDPGRMLRELRLAKKSRKPLILLAEAKVNLPKIFQNTEKEYVRTDGPITEEDLLHLVEMIDETYRTGGYRKVSA